MRRHTIIVERDGKRHTMYSGAQLTHTSVMLRHLKAKGENAWIESEEKKTIQKKPILSSITGKPIKKRTIRK